MAAFEIICENRAFLKKCGLQLQFINRRDSADQVLQKMLQNYLEHLVHLSTAAPLENILEIIWFLSWWKKIISHTPKIETARTSFIMHLLKNGMSSYLLSIK